MDTCGSACSFCSLFAGISWFWYIVAVIVVYGLGAIWHSFLFAKTWMRVFKVEMPDTVNKSAAVFTMVMQLVATALFGLALFVLVKLSLAAAILALVAFCGWQKGTLKFRYTKWKEYFQAALVEAGYTFLAGAVFILFAALQCCNAC